MKRIGTLNEGSSKIPLFLDGDIIKDDKGRDLTKTVKFCLSNPWEGAANWHKVVQLDNGDYKCTYKSIFIDIVDVEIQATGKTEKIAQENCQNILTSLGVMS